MRRWFTEPRTMVSSDHRSCGRSPIRGLLREAVRAYRISDGWIRRGQTGVRQTTDPVRRGLLPSCGGAATAALQLQLGAPRQLGRRPRRTGSVVWRTRVRPRRIHPSQTRCRRKGLASMRSPLISTDQELVLLRTHHPENFRSESSEAKNISETVFRNFRNRLANQNKNDLEELD